LKYILKVIDPTLVNMQEYARGGMVA